MTDIRDFTPGASEQRGAITVQRYADAGPRPVGDYDHDEFWRFGVQLAPEDGEPLEVWLRLHAVAVQAGTDDTALLAVVAAELLAMTHPGAVLADGRKVAGLKPEDLLCG